MPFEWIKQVPVEPTASGSKIDQCPQQIWQFFNELLSIHLEVDRNIAVDYSCSTMLSKIDFGYRIIDLVISSNTIKLSS